MQEGYEADGWLGLLLGTSVWYAMYGATLESESAFDDRMSALSREIGTRGRADAEPAGDEPEPSPEESEGVANIQQPHSALREELARLKVSALEQRALAVGASADATEDALDDDDPKAALIGLIVSCAGSSGGGGAELRRELEGLRLKELRARARSEGVGAEAMAAAMDSDDPRAALVEALAARSEM